MQRDEMRCGGSSDDSYSQLLATAAAHWRVHGGRVTAPAQFPLPTSLIPLPHPLPVRFLASLWRRLLLLLS